MKNGILYILLVVSFTLAGGRAVSQSARSSREAYIEKYAPLAVEHQQRYGIPASIKLAQALLESNDGKSRLATQAHNHFGIKCKKDWTGGKIYHDDDAKGECFRSYKTTEESFEDHSEFLTGGSRYASLFELDPKDYKGWAYGLKAAGYATSPTYAPALIKIIEDYELYRYDSGSLPAKKRSEERKSKAKQRLSSNEYYSHTGGVDLDNFSVALNTIGGRGVEINNQSRYVVALADDSLEKVSRDSGIRVARLRKINDLGKNDAIKENDIVYLEKKLKVYTGSQNRHEVSDGESMRDISQRYGLSMSSLRKMNKSLARGNQLHAGEEIKLM